MSDRMREMFYDPDQGLYDCDPYPSVLADLKAQLAALEAGGGNFLPDPDWMSSEEAIDQTKRDIAEIEAKIAKGFNHPVDEARARRRELDEAVP